VDLYTLSPTFLAQDNIDQFVSAIWTERYSTAGDVQLVVPATGENLEKLADGTFLGLRGSKEVMQIETQSIEKGLMTVVGNTLDEFLNQRAVWFKNPDYPGASADKIVDYTDATKTPGAFIADVVDKMTIHTANIPSGTGSDYTKTNLNWPFEVIPFLTLGPVDNTGDVKRITIPIGPLYDGISKIATDEGVGISLYLESADPVTGYSLKFTTYRGIDHSTGGAGELVRLVPELDSISDLKELRSIQQFKNVVYVYYQGEISKHLADPTAPEPEGFDRRVLVTDAEGEPVGHKVTSPGYGGFGGSYTQIVVGPDDLAAFREQNAKDALANHNYIRAIDGQSSPASDYKFGEHYGLGDVIELEGLTGLISKARVTEYIRSQDQTGIKEYPTISVIS
jgi:Siphovirus ReqiPepy6 Gp37-like protein